LWDLETVVNEITFVQMLEYHGTCIPGYPFYLEPESELGCTIGDPVSLNRIGLTQFCAALNYIV
jgi:hypothetical protein